MARLPNTITVIRKLFALSGNQCAFPGCSHNLITPEGHFIGQICHIEGANEKGQRYNPGQTDEERRSAENLMLLCYEHHIVTNDVQKYSVASLHELKKEHEVRFMQDPFLVTDEMLKKIISDLQIRLNEVYELSQDTNATVHDLKDLVLKSLTKPAFDEQKFYISQLDSIKELKKQGKYKTVADLLLEFKQKNWESIGAETQSKVLVNLGMCYFDLHEVKKGCEILMQLKNISHETGDGLAFICLASAILQKGDDFDIYFERMA